jgi:acetyltransferase-like isoleucine patch superfamily enzyme
MIYENVIIGIGAKIGENVIIGEPPRGTKPGELKTIIGNNAVIRSGTIIYAGNKIGDNFQTGHHTTVRENNTIGNNVSLGSHSSIEHSTTIGDNVRFHSYVFVPEYCKIHNDAWLGPRVTLTNTPYPLAPNAKEVMKEKAIIIKEKAIIGAGSIILPGVIIGSKSFIGAGSVVTKSTEPELVYIGNPACEMQSIYDLGEEGIRPYQK